MRQSFLAVAISSVLSQLALGIFGGAVKAETLKVPAVAPVDYSGTSDNVIDRTNTERQKSFDASTPIKLVVFPFELLDFSGGASIIPESEQDKQALKASTEAARQLMQKSGRYYVIDDDTVQDREKRALQECDGCEAVIAKDLGGEQSLLGIVTRITRTDYAVTFRLRNAKDGKLIAIEQTDLRIGANYSWDRGTKWLIEHRLLHTP